MPKRQIYINFQAPGCEIETIDQFDNHSQEDKKEVRRVIGEYQLAYPRCRVWLSTRPCKGWDND